MLPVLLDRNLFCNIAAKRLEQRCCQPVPGSEIVVKSSSVKRNAKNARGLGKDRAPPCPFFPPPPHPFPSRARLIFALLVLIRPHYIYYLRAWHRLRYCAFYQQHSNLSCNNSGCCRLRKIVAESRELVLFFAIKSVHRHVALFASPK